MTLYHSILRSNNVGTIVLAKEWVDKYKNHNGISIKIIENKIQITGTPQCPIFVIRDLPPEGYELEFINIPKVYFLDIKEANLNKIPKKFKFCDNVIFNYCTIPTQYKYLKFHYPWTKPTIENCTFI